MKQVRTQYVNLFEDMDFTIRLLSGEFDSAISKGQMKIEQVSNNKRPAKAKQIIAVVQETIEEPVQKSTDIEKAMAVLDGSCTDMTAEDFTDEAWAEANEKYYSMDDMDYKEEVSPEGETVITMSGERLIDFLMDRADTVSTWDDDEEASEEYIYEDDEVNVNEECDATILSFAKAFDCMSNKAEEVAPTSESDKSRLDTLLDIIIENQEEFRDRGNRHYADDESYKKCPDCYDLNNQGLTADELTDKALARALYMNIRRDSLDVRDNRILMPGQSQKLRCIYDDKYTGDELFTKDDLLDVLIDKFNKVGRVKYYADFCGIKDDIRALNRAIA